MTRPDSRCACCPRGFTFPIGRQLLCVSPHEPRVTYSHSCLLCDAPIPPNQIFCGACEAEVSISDPAFPSAGVTTAAASVPPDAAAVVTTNSEDLDLDSLVTVLEACWSRAPKSPQGDRQAVAEASIPGLKLSAAVDGACIACPAFLASRKATTFRVAAESAIQVAASSSHIFNSIHPN